MTLLHQSGKCFTVYFISKSDALFGAIVLKLFKICAHHLCWWADFDVVYNTWKTGGEREGKWGERERGKVGREIACCPKIPFHLKLLKIDAHTYMQALSNLKHWLHEQKVIYHVPWNVQFFPYFFFGTTFTLNTQYVCINLRNFRRPYILSARQKCNYVM